MAWKVNSEVYIRHRFVLPTGERDLMDQEDDGKDVEAMVTCSSLRKKITRHYTDLHGVAWRNNTVVTRELPAVPRRAQHSLPFGRGVTI